MPKVRINRRRPRLRAAGWPWPRPRRWHGRFGYGPREDALLTYVDRLVDAPTGAGNATPRGIADVAPTASQIHRTLADDTTELAPDRRRELWEDLMASVDASPSSRPLHEGSSGRSGPWREHRHEAPPRNTAEGIRGVTRSGPARFTERWSPLVSAALVVLLAVGTMAGFQAFDRSASDPASSLTPPGDQAHLIQSELPKKTYPNTCDAPEPITPVEQLLGLSYIVFPQRFYAPIAPATPFFGQLAVDTWAANQACTMQSLSSGEGFMSDRFRYEGLYFQLPPAEQALLEEAGERQPEIFAEFPLPVNQPSDTFNYDNGSFMQGFTPGDVFLMSDGRYGAISGTISVETLRTGRTSIVDAPMFIGFQQVGNRLLIDEWTPLCPEVIWPEGANQATPPTIDAELRCTGLPF